MRKTVDQHVLDSLREYLNHVILRDLQAFELKTGVSFYPYNPKIAGHTAYGSPYAQLVYDSSIPGATVPTSIGGYNRGDNGMKIDFFNGRALFTSPVSPGAITGNISVNEVNVYTTTKGEQRLIFEEKLEAIKDGTYFPPNSLAAPAVFIRNFNANNETYCFGGVNNNIYRFKVVCLLDTMTQLQGLQYVIRESRDVHIPLIEDSIFTAFGDLRSGSYNYQNIAENSEAKLRITDTSFANVTDHFESVQQGKYVAIGNMELNLVSHRNLNF